MENKKERKFYGLSGNAINMIRELLQLALITNTNIVDHFRQFRLEPSEENEQLLVPTAEYMEYYNKALASLEEEVNNIVAAEGEKVKAESTSTNN